MTKLLPTIQSPLQLHDMKLEQLNQVADEIRETLCNLLSLRAAHFASNLGVVELTLALHSTYDFLERPVDLGYRTSDLSSKTDYRAVRRVSYNPYQRRIDGLPQSRRKRLRPVHDRPRRVQCFDRRRFAQRRRHFGNGTIIRSRLSVMVRFRPAS